MPKLLERVATYVEWHVCPLCGGAGLDRDYILRRNYRFGKSLIPLPAEGVILRECNSCGLLFKSAVPDLRSIGEILEREAVNEWRPKVGDHPSVPWLRSIIAGESQTDVLDIGASNGDLLRGLTGYCNRLSAFDAVRYPACESTITGEYIIGSFEGQPQWSEVPYDLVTAFDVFEHFLEPRKAILNILGFLKPGAKLVIETGNWHAARTNPGQWYYCNLFEHQIFWSKKAFEVLCDTYNLDLRQCEYVNHKYRREMSSVKRLGISTYRMTARFDWMRKITASLFGVDPRLLSPPRFQDHLFVVLQNKG